MGLSKRIQNILTILPLELAKQVQSILELRTEMRSIRGQLVDGTYDPETNRILLWGNLEMDDFDLIIVLMHEIGHFLYHQKLTDREKGQWVQIHEKESLDFRLKDYYPSVQIPEETFCCILSVVGIIYWLEKQRQMDRAKKTREKLEKLAPNGTKFVEQSLKKTGPAGTQVIFHSTVKIIRRWIEAIAGPLK